MINNNKQQLEELDRTSIQTSETLHALKNLCLILDFYVTSVQETSLTAMTARLELTSWIRLKESLESFALSWLLSDDSQVWAKCGILLSILLKPSFRTLSEQSAGISASPLLGEGFDLTKLSLASMNTQFCPELLPFLSESKVERYRVVIESTWNKLLKVFKIEGALWVNYGRFLALTVQVVEATIQTSNFVEIVSTLLFSNEKEQSARAIEMIAESNKSISTFLRAYVEEKEKKIRKETMRKKGRDFYTMVSLFCL
jgi:hypothetical protein